MEESLPAECFRIALQAKAASKELRLLNGQRKNQWLVNLSELIQSQQAKILQANELDLRSAAEHGLSAANVDRLKLSPARIESMAEGLRQIAALPDPVGEVREGSLRPNGLQVLKIGAPLGVIFFLYESRPNVTTDAAGLCLKSGNAVILRGGKEAWHSNQALYQLCQECLAQLQLPAHAVQLVPTMDRAAVGEFLKLSGQIDLVIPRGGESLIRRVVAEATMPVLKHFQGICHVYVDEAADLVMAEAIIVNGKCQRPGVCNAVESVLIHQAIAAELLVKLGANLKQRGVEIRGCETTCRYLPESTVATNADYGTEYLDLIVSMKVVSGFDEAIAHIDQYGSQHTEAIVTQNIATAQRFAQTVDAAAIVVNASTRFHDGFEIGLGAEIGISTDKFHARGPCGLRELTTTKYILTGQGQIRQ